MFLNTTHYFINVIKMIDFWGFLAVAIIVWGIVRIYKISKGVKHEHRKIKKIKEKEISDVEGLLVGGLVMLFIGIGLFFGFYYSLGMGPWMIGGFIVGGIGLALLISYSVLKGKK